MGVNLQLIGVFNEPIRGCTLSFRVLRKNKLIGAVIRLKEL